MITKTLEFKKEISYIKNPEYKESAEKLLEFVPDYFFTVPASSTGKYHPEYAATEKGLVKHTKVAVTIASKLLSLESFSKKFSDREKDLIIIALLFHDSLKKGRIESRYTKFEHPLLVGSFLLEYQNITKFSDEDIKYLKEIIASHMGEWNKNDYSNIKLPKPVSEAQIFVHMCDYLASQKFLNVEFSDDEIIM